MNLKKMIVIKEIFFFNFVMQYFKMFKILVIKETTDYTKNNFKKIIIIKQNNEKASF